MPDKHSIETWRDIEDLPGYQVSDLGRIRSVDRLVMRSDGATERRRGQLLATGTGTHGYLLVTFWVRRDGKRRHKSYSMHRLVTTAFLGPRPGGKEVNHRNGVKTDNRLENLEYVTKVENEHHAHQIGLKNHRGEANPVARLTEKDVQACKELYRQGVSQRELARRFGVSQPAVSLAVNGKNWKHVP